ncbi:DUF2800 domain-containing protein [Paracerasibacillus soli]|uniref:DUF2800 domain-containing protein n=1 Tax=Paracerasibacillus soli TaxID=480284 RepID=A0ABU5CW65_9BACI|nr:DUF2800 domain-containing protein [Virgibacillus soli]MDY0410617.1 DUF2800 domain-containing protein [Virgibacillus soli]
MILLNGRMKSLLMQRMLLSSKENSGQAFKVVEGRSNRKYTDEEAVAEAAKKAGYEDIYKQSLLTITNMEKLMVKRNLMKCLVILLLSQAQKPTLVPYRISVQK